ncbi:MAG TPA: DUF2889 domain-containing protein [Kiloniellales bacterium]|nr:DUF2889 domain-containing protein [Kiloniellales bacterium]
MPLSPPVPREHLHRRTYEFQGYRRADRLWDIEGRIVDVKAYGFDSQDRGRVEAGVPVHEMAIRLTVDDRLVVKAIEAVTEHGPYNLCGAIAPNYQAMVGVRVGPGWRQAIKARLGGAAGCTHMSELLMAMATPCYQTIYPVLSRERRAAEGEPEEEMWPGLVDSCHAYASDGPLVKKWLPDRYTGTE